MLISSIFCIIISSTMSNREMFQIRKASARPSLLERQGALATLESRSVVANASSGSDTNSTVNFIINRKFVQRAFQPPQIYHRGNCNQQIKAPKTYNFLGRV